MRYASQFARRLRLESAEGYLITFDKPGWDTGARRVGANPIVKKNLYSTDFLWWAGTKSRKTPNLTFGLKTGGGS